MSFKGQMWNRHKHFRQFFFTSVTDTLVKLVTLTGKSVNKWEEGVNCSIEVASDITAVVTANN